MPDNPPEPPPPPPPPPLSPRASNSALPRTPSSKRPSNKQVDVGDGGMLAAIASPDKRPSLKKTQSDDKSSPMIDAEASLRREVLSIFSCVENARALVSLLWPKDTRDNF